ncbi:TusE/DsrC/DsvC family sulfur relay protein [Amphritea pacifica]|uniref:Sulfurtransferase n=1 Tax=Amphritea pacifica TaxID=2811233 RepID=A0ABS2W975_9GAMM|nr:TusE/DsrC/DsvC family sulfur relay protein [Amphritea pacifica]MBN0987937.1 TusE/DsrC/DsvC family sulfur relay protein [Amphritea pacifica]MBN1005479.1 TusE/DsrC/DsvC family sulfur relay protein [Amphritea pacifica]
MENLDVNGQAIAIDNEGYLRNLEDWSKEAAMQLAQQEGIELTDAHWEILHLLRDFYQTYEMSPAMRPLIKAVAAKLGSDKGKSIYLMSLFPGSPAKLASKIAGLPKPTNCL